MRHHQRERREIDSNEGKHFGKCQDSLRVAVGSFLWIDCGFDSHPLTLLGETLTYIKYFFSSLLEFMYMPLVRAHVREMALRAPLFPGQLWVLPMLGVVRIKSTSDYTVTYTALDDTFDESHVVKRSEFFKFASPYEEKPKAAIPFTVIKKEDK